MNRKSLPPGVYQRRVDDIKVQLAELDAEADQIDLTLRAMRNELGQEPLVVEIGGQPTTISGLMTEGVHGTVTRTDVEAALAAHSLKPQMPEQPMRITADGAPVKNFDKILNAAFGKNATEKAIGIIRDKRRQLRAEASKIMEGPSIGPRVIGSSDDDRMQSPIFRRELTVALREWLLCEKLILQTPHRCAHKGIENLGLSTVRYRNGKRVDDSESKLDSGLQVVMVEHDWARLFKSATFEGGGGADEWQLPFDAQVYEFAISGAAVLALTYTTEAATTLSLAIRSPKMQSWTLDQAGAMMTASGWSYLDHHDLIEQGEPIINAAFDRLYDFIYQQIKAVAIMLEARVAEREVTRAPYKTNKPPRDAKPLPKLSHHVIRLSRDPRPAPLPAADRQQPGTGTRKRLHFRRGHWRHYSNHKTWIKWTLVGDPDLGFVDKEYRT